MKHIKLHDVVEANNLLISMGAEDQLPRIASAAIERSLELQHRVDRAIRYAEEAHSSSLHVKQVLRILDGSITLDDEMNEMDPEPVVHPLDEYPRLVQPALPKGTLQERMNPSAYEMPPANKLPRDGSSGLAGRSTEQRKAFRDWLAAQGVDLPLNQAVPQNYVDTFDQATGNRHKPKPKPKPTYTGTRGKLQPGHGLAGRSEQERLHIRTWLTEQGFDINPTGRIPQKHINHYDAAMAELKRMQREQKQQPQEQEQHAQGA
jgi:hypothetical protein